MKLRTITSAKIKKGMRIFMRIDANVPLKNGHIAEGGADRLERIAPNISALQKKGVRLVLASHLGRPDGKKDPKLSLKPVATRLARLLELPVHLATDVIGEEVEEEVQNLQPGDVLLLENLRFYAGEEKNRAAFAKALAGLADIYVNDAFGVCHRKHASVAAITKYIPSFAGPLVCEEVKALQEPLKDPLMLVLGGNKIETKMPLLKKITPEATLVLLGSGMREAAPKLKKMFGTKIVAPLDVRGGDDPHDIGPETQALYCRLLEGAQSVIWNGPLGIVERKDGQAGTKAVATCLAKRRSVRRVVGGGDTVAFLQREGLCEDFSFVSSGGGAMLAFLAGEKLPGLEPLVL